MHERSLVRSLLRHVGQIAAENDASQICEVTVEVGPLSGVEVDLVRSAFDQLAPSTKLTICEVPLTIHCLQCDQTSELSDFNFRLAACDSGQVKVIGGDEFRLRSLSISSSPLLDDPSPPPSRARKESA